MGEAAGDALRRLIGGRVVRLEYDAAPEEVDLFGRTLGHLFVRQPDRNWLHLNLELVRLGYTPYFGKYGFSQRFHDAFVAAHQEAIASRRGVWGPSGRDGNPHHYDDYEERLAWWNRCGDAIAEHRRLREADPTRAPIGLYDPAEHRRLERAVGRTTQVVASFIRANREDREVELEFRSGGRFVVRFLRADDFRQAWSPQLYGEYVRAEGTLTREGDGFALSVSGAQAFSPMPAR